MKIVLITLMCMLLLQCLKSQPKINEIFTVIEGQFQNYRPDTVTLAFYFNRLGHANKSVGCQKYKAVCENGFFKFKLPGFDGPKYFTLSSSMSPRLYLEDYIVEPGDSVHLEINPSAFRRKLSDVKGGISFTGKRIEKIVLRYKMDSVVQVFTNSISKDDYLLTQQELASHIGNLFESFKKVGEPIRNKKLTFLNDNSKNITVESLEIIKCDILYEILYFNIQSFSIYWDEGFSYPDSSSRREMMIKYYKERFENEVESQNVSLMAKIGSKYYTSYCVSKSLLDPKIMEVKNKNLSAVKPYELAKQSALPLREKIATSFLATMLTFGSKMRDIEPCLADALSFVKNEDYLSILDSYNTAMLKGRPAYNFNLPDTKGALVSLEQLKGKTILVDFWFTGCKPCINVGRTLPLVKENFKNNNDIVFVSISTDINKDNWLKSVKSELYTKADAINLYTDKQGMDHPLIKYYNFSGFPRLLIIDKYGNIFSSNPDRPDGPGGVEKLTEQIKQAINL